MLVKNSLESKVSAVQMVAGNQAVRKTEMWLNEYVQGRIYMAENYTCWSNKLNVCPTHLKWAKIVVWEGKIEGKQQGFAVSQISEDTGIS